MPDARPDAGRSQVGGHDGEICPRRLPESSGDDHGFGTAEPAASTPNLPDPESAWICQYDPVPTGPGPGGDGTTWGWSLAGAADEVLAARIPDLRRDLKSFVPADPDQTCTADLGSRLMLVYTHREDVIGVVVDDFGCGEVRLTDDPFGVSPGESSGAGTVSGVLASPPGLADRLRAIKADASE